MPYADPEVARVKAAERRRFRRQHKRNEAPDVRFRTDSSTEEVERFKLLLEHEPYLAHRMLSIRRLMEHRGIHPWDVIVHSGRSREWVYRCIRPTSVSIEGIGESRTPGGNVVLPEIQHLRLDELESFITQISDARGGMTYNRKGFIAACGCTSEAYEALVRDISEGWGLRTEESEGNGPRYHKPQRRRG